ncbi:MAG: NnrU family protein [Pseudomonadota bacterium]
MLLLFAVVLFAILHLVPAFPSLKASLKDRLGKAYGMLFAVGSIVSLVLIVLGWQTADRAAVYDPPAWGFSANLALSFVAFLLLGVFLFRGRARQVLRLPLAMAVVLWATGHLLANGDQASVILFGGLLAYGAIHLAAGFAQGFRPSPEVRQGHDVIALFVSVALYGVMIQMHQHIIGVALFSIQDMAIFAK